MRRVALTGLLGTGIAFAGFHLHQSPGALPEYKTEKVKRRTLTQQVTASGPLAPALKAEVGSPMAGTTLEIHADFGSAVEAGEPLAQLDPATAELTLKEARIKLSGAQAAVDLGRRRAEQIKALYDEGLTPETDYEKAVSELRQAKGNARIAEAGVARARIELDRCIIRAPLKGVVISRNVSVGQSVDTGNGTPPLFVIANDLARMQIEANVAESDIGGVRPRMEATFTVDAFPDETFKGTVTQVRALPVIDQTVVSYPVIIDADNRDLKLKPGMTANVSIVLEEREDVLTIPNKALRFRPSDGAKGDDEGGSTATIYRLVPAGSGEAEEDRGSLEAVSIMTGISDGRSTEVLGGLSEGDRLVVGLKSTDKDKEGLLARIPELLAGNGARKKGR